MRDSHIGTMGVLAVAGVLLLKVALLASIDGPVRWRLVLLAPIAGRCALAPGDVACFPTPGGEAGLGTIFRVSGRRACSLAVWAVVVAVRRPAGSARRTAGLAIAGASLAGSLLLGWYIHRRIGGYTGDTLGATSELVEVSRSWSPLIWAV